MIELRTCFVFLLKFIYRSNVKGKVRYFRIRLNGLFAFALLLSLRVVASNEISFALTTIIPEFISKRQFLSDGTFNMSLSIILISSSKMLLDHLS